MEEHTTQEKTSKPAKETKTVKTTASAAPAEETRTQRPSARTGRTMSRPAIQQAPRQPNGAKPMDARALNKLSMPELTKLAINYNIEDISGLRKQELIGRIVAVQAKQNGSVYGGGVLEILPDGFGFLRSEENNYLSGAEHI